MVAQVIPFVETSVDIFFEELRRYPVLPDSEQVSLCVAAQAGDKDARDRLVAHSMRLVVFVAKRYRSEHLSLLDRVQAGALGLLRAIEKFNAGRGVHFSTYAIWWVRQAVLRQLSDQDFLIRAPTHVRTRQRHLAWLFVEHPDASVEEVGVLSGYSAGQLASVAMADFQVVSLDAVVSDKQHPGKPMTYAGVLVAPSTQEDVCFERHDLVLRLLEQLDERERVVLRARYGFDGEVMTLADVGKLVGLTMERVRQIEQKALKKLRGILADRVVRG